MKNLKIEIVVLVYARAYHSIKVFESLFENGVSSFTVFFDKADNQLSKDEQKKIIYYLDKNNFLDVKKVFNKKKIGLAKSVINAITFTLQKNDAIIFLEDDCVLRPGGIQYFIDGLRNMKDNKRVKSICGYSYPISDLHWGSNQELVFLLRFSTWGWATWADRWKKYNNNLKEIIDIIDSKGLSIDNFSNDLAILCKDKTYLNEEKDIWSLQWVLQHFIDETYAVFPRESYIDNVGMDGTGVHCKRTKVFDNSIHRSLFVIRDWERIQYYPQNEIIIKNFMDKNGKIIY